MPPKRRRSGLTAGIRCEAADGKDDGGGTQDKKTKPPASRGFEQKVKLIQKLSLGELRCASRCFETVLVYLVAGTPCIYLVFGVLLCSSLTH